VIGINKKRMATKAKANWALRLRTRCGGVFFAKFDE